MASIIPASSCGPETYAWESPQALPPTRRSALTRQSVTTTTSTSKTRLTTSSAFSRRQAPKIQLGTSVPSRGRPGGHALYEDCLDHVLCDFGYAVRVACLLPNEQQQYHRVSPGSEWRAVVLKQCAGWITILGNVVFDSMVIAALSYVHLFKALVEWMRRGW